MPLQPYMSIQNKIISYVKAGCLLHTITLIELFLSFCLIYFVDIPLWLSKGYVGIKLIALSPIVGMPLFAQLDARSRYQNYKLIKDQLFIYGFQKRILKPFVKSRCQRDAVKAAASELGMSVQCREHFKNLGYNWYHLFPDAIFKKPSVLLEKNFWITTLFTKRYFPKIDFEKKKIVVTIEKCKAA
jgi:hypothetical protein